MPASNTTTKKFQDALKKVNITRDNLTSLVSQVLVLLSLSNYQQVNF